MNLTSPDFQGSTFVAERDEARLTSQLQRVADFMRRSDWVTLSQIATAAVAPEASASARLRDMRRAGYQIERRYLQRGQWAYRLAYGQGELPL